VSYSREVSANLIRYLPNVRFQGEDTLRDRLLVDVLAIWYDLHVLNIEVRLHASVHTSQILWGSLRSSISPSADLVRFRQSS